MLANTHLYHADDNSHSSSDSDSDSDSKSDLIYVAPQHDKYKGKKSSFLPSKMVLPTLATYKKKPKMTFDWVPGTLSSISSSAASLTSDSFDTDDSDFDIKHQLQQMLKRNKARKPKRLMSPTLSPSEDHINILQMTRKPLSISNFTKFKNRLSAAAATLNTSI